MAVDAVVRAGDQRAAALAEQPPLIVLLFYHSQGQVVFASQISTFPLTALFGLYVTYV